MRTIVIGDIHGCYDELVALIEKVQYNKESDKLIFLGDYIDRGKDSSKVVAFIRDLQRQNKNVIALRGNHEQMCIDYSDTYEITWWWNGAQETVDSYGANDEQFKSDVRWMETLPLYYEDDNYIYVHAGIDANKPLDQQSDTMLWVRETFINSTAKFDKQVIFGHTPAQSAIHSDVPYYTLANNL